MNVGKKPSKARVARPAKNKKESVANLLERESDSTIRAWMERVDQNEELNAIHLNYEERTGHLPKLMRDLIFRLRLSEGTKRPVSVAAGDHGTLRHQQGYTVPMVVEESRLLQVSIFQMLHQNMARVDFSQVMADVGTIADEVDSQLKEQLVSFMEPRIAPSATQPGSC